MLLAFAMWRRMLTLGPSQFGEVYYLGTAPDEGDEGQLLDVIVGVHDAIEVQFFLEPATGKLRRIELFTNKGSDPCELVIREQGPFDQWTLPKEITVLHGDTTFATLRIDKFEVLPAIQPAS